MSGHVQVVLMCVCVCVCVCAMQVGTDDDGYNVRLKLRYFLEYCTHPEHGSVDDSPLYIFDGSFADRDGSKGTREVGTCVCMHVCPVCTHMGVVRLSEIVYVSLPKRLRTRSMASL